MRDYMKFYLFRKLFLAFLLLNVLSVAAVGLILYLDYHRIIRSGNQETLERSLEQLDLSLRELYENFCEDAYGIISLRESVSFMRRKEVDRIEEYRLQQYLKVLAAANARLDDLGVANFYTDRFLSTKKVYFGLEWLRKAQEQGKEKADFEGDPGKLIWQGSEEASYEEMTGLNMLYVPAKDISRGVIVGSISPSSLQEMLDRSRIIDSQQIAVITEQGQCMGETGLWEEEITDYIEVNQGRRFQKAFRREGTAWLLTGVPSELEGVTLVSMCPEREQAVGTKHIFKLYVICIAGLFLIHVFLSLWLSRMLYMPIQKLVKQWVNPEGHLQKERIDELERLEHTLQLYDEIARRNQVEYYLNGAGRDVRFSHEIYDKIAKEISGKGLYRVALFAMDDGKEEAVCRETEVLLNQMLEQELKDCFLLPKCLRREGRIFLNVVGAETPDQADVRDTLLALKGAQIIFYRYKGINMSISLGKTVESMAELPDSWENAMAGLKYRLVEGRNILFDGDRPPGRKGEKGYPDKAARQLLEYVMNGNYEKMAESLNRFVTELRECGAGEIVPFAWQLCETIAQRLLESGKAAGEDIGKQLEEQKQRLESCVVREELRMTLWEFFCQALTAPCKKEENETESRQNAIWEAVNYIQLNYGNPMLSVDTLAERAGMSTGYFGKQFHGECRKSCTEYIADVRMKAAARSLVETDALVREISEQVGIYNVNYFYSLFKKHYGKTPNQFRKDNKKHE